MAKVTIRFGCAKQSKNLEWYQINISQQKLWMVSTAIFRYPSSIDVNSSSREERQKTNETNQNFMQKRLTLLNNVCNMYKNPFRVESSSLHYHSNFSKISSFQYFWFKDKYNMICSIQKAGSNSVHNFLRKILQVT